MTKLNVFAAVLETGEFSYGKVCQDCENILANGYEPTAEDGWGAEQIANVEKNCGMYEFTLGHMHKDNDAWSNSNTCYHYGSDCEDDCTCARTDYSHVNCDMCGNRYVGYRADVIMIRRDLLDTNMTQEQFDKLQLLCKRYDVAMLIRDYFVYSPESSMMAGWAEGWIGGQDYSPSGACLQTIYIGVSPEGDSHS